MDLDEMVDAYAECAVWAGLDWDTTSTTGGPDDNPRPLDERYSTDDIDASAWESIREDCTDFAEHNATDLDGMDPRQAGHDFYLTRHGHGAGFWDRGLGERGDRLTAAARVYGSSELYPADGKLYL